MIKNAGVLPASAVPAASGRLAGLLNGLGQGLAPRLREWPALTRSLSLLFPGIGHIARGDVLFGVFLLTSLAFVGSLAWAVLETVDRLSGTLSWLGVPITSVFWTLGGLYAAGAALHLIGVFSSGDVDEDLVLDYHPVLTASLSALVPGWGQLLNGNRVRASLFVLGIWLSGAVWLAVSPEAVDLMNRYLPGVSTFEQALRRPELVWSFQWSLPVLVWALAVYDAFQSAVYRR